MKREWVHKRLIGCAAALGLVGILAIPAVFGNSGNAFAEGSENRQEVVEVQRENGWEAANRDTEYVYCVGSVS